jgi:hypothetical protein
MTDEERFAALRREITEVLAAALESAERHAAEMERRDETHIAETGRRDELHVQEMQRRDDLHAQEMENVREALETRDIIGQAKGVIMAALFCSPDEAFDLIRKQSQRENRKLVDIAVEIAGRTSRLPGAPSGSP